ncbi:GntR family transcriptional regulator [Phytoactinopolyspora mesophila]|uniref:GntR family transcriptional regulator n=1 Tax=Phytoactinopolyspora mesophila TaxID=2650750 RepID=A0A7K3MBN1_9ACTN|nr:GntR family transcriptional regulator [Phytoactinopolyspora mesophila]
MSGEPRGTVEPFSRDDDEPGYLYRQVADHIEARILAGELPTGSRLPGERDLAVEYGVSIGTVRRATEVLREQGQVVTLPAKGSFITLTRAVEPGG